MNYLTHQLLSQKDLETLNVQINKDDTLWEDGKKIFLLDNADKRLSPGLTAILSEPLLIEILTVYKLYIIALICVATVRFQIN